MHLGYHSPDVMSTSEGPRPRLEDDLWEEWLPEMRRYGGTRKPLRRMARSRRQITIFQVRRQNLQISFWKGFLAEPLMAFGTEVGVTNGTSLRNATTTGRGCLGGHHKLL